MKTDTQLQKDVMDEIKWEPSTTAAQIGVTADEARIESAPSQGNG
jgi:hypothetical protein